MNCPDLYLPIALFIDDDHTLHLWVNRYLSNAGFRVISCFDGEEGLEAFKEMSPDIVLIDIQMPILDGFETCRALRNLPNGKNTPVIMMTVTEDPEGIAHAYACGATDFVVKPINWEILIHRLHYMVKASHNLRRLALNELRLSKAQKMARLGDWEWHATRNSLHWSNEIYALLGLDKDEFTPNTRNFRDFIHIADMPYVLRHLRTIIKTKKAATIEFRIITSTHQERFVAQQIEPLLNHKADFIGLVGIIQDITERKEHENKIRHLAYYDEITQLPNRVFFLQFLTKTIELAKRNKRHFAILFLDLDGFKGINDTYGHQVGDMLLKEVSTRLTDGLRCSDLASRFFDYFDHKVDVARLGGDEFIILLNELAQPEDAATVAERIKRWITKPISLGDRQMHIGVSMGITVYPHDGDDSGTLLKNADMAMYHAKKLGKGHYQFFHKGMALRAEKRLEMETYMNLAVAKNELRLHYQPVVDARSGRMIGAEALLRWQCPQLGFLPPNDFISLAEENGMINQFGAWVIREVCRQYNIWQQQDFDGLTISVNLSSLQFNQTSFIPMIESTLQEYRVDPAFLTFELTESVIMADTDKMLVKLNELKKLGIKLSVDDFGTGYSSLSYLNRFPLDYLKIDRSFVKELSKSQDADAIVNAILALAKALNLKTIAEGVETAQQKQFLQNSTCDAIQGYYYSKPVPVEEFQHFWTLTNKAILQT